MRRTQSLIRGTAVAALGLAALLAGTAAGAAPTVTAATTTTPTTTTPTTTTPTTTTPTTPTTTTPTTTTPTTTTPTTTTPRPPAKAGASLYLSKDFTVAHRAVTIPRRAVLVSGVVRPFVPGQSVVVTESLNGKRFQRVTLRLKPSAHRVYGGFTWPVSSPGVGNVTVSVSHKVTRALSKFAVRDSFTALDTNVSFGSTGAFVQLVQQRLSALHFFIPLTGVYDQHTGLAVDAYHRLLSHGTSQQLDPATVSNLLNGVGTFQIRFPNQGAHAEGDLTHQLLALANGSKVYWILPISSGKPSTPTILGSFQVYYRVPGYLPGRDVLLEFLHPRFCDPRLRPGSRLPGQSRLHATSDRRRDSRFWLAEIRRLGRHVLPVSAAMDARDRLLHALREHALVIGEVVLTSGRTAQYLDRRQARHPPAGWV